MISGVAVEPPKDMPKPEETDAMYAELEKLYKWPKALSKYLKEVIEIDSPEDFVAAFRTERDWDRFNDADIKDDLNNNAVIGRGVKGRVARAHKAFQDATEAARKQKAQGEDNSDLNVLLDPKDIKEMITRFWRKHKIKFPSDQMPGDLLLSRVAREMERRFFHITNIMKVKGVDVERRGQTKKKEIGGGLQYTATAEEVDVDRPETVTAYLAAMAMYMLALAIWGSKPRDPQPAEEESRETDPVDYVYFPYQHSLDYVHRANKFVVEALAELSAPQVFTMLRKRDEEERTMWVDKVRGSDKPTLGQIFKEIYDRREQR